MRLRRFAESKITKMTENATLNRAIHIYASDCNYDENIKLEPIFGTSAGFIKPKDVSFVWKRLVA